MNWKYFSHYSIRKFSRSIIFQLFESRYYSESKSFQAIFASKRRSTWTRTIGRDKTIMRVDYKCLWTALDWQSIVEQAARLQFTTITRSIKCRNILNCRLIEHKLHVRLASFVEIRCTTRFSSSLCLTIFEKCSCICECQISKYIMIRNKW